MSNKPYDYSTRKGILPVSWEDFHGICKALALAVSAFDPQVVLPIGRGGYYAGTLIGHLLELDVYPIWLSRRTNGVPVYEEPHWVIRPPRLVRGKRVLVVDEISGSGRTLSMTKAEVASLGAQEIRSAVLYAHTWGTETPDFIGLVTDALIMNPWDRETLIDGEFQLHTEYARALDLQGLKPDPSLLIQATPVSLAKG